MFAVSCKKCQTLLLAEGANCSVHGCTCGVVQFTSGGMTVRLAADAFLDIAWTVEQAAMKLVGDEVSAADSAQKVH